MSATTSEFELKPVGGVLVRNRQGKVVLWFKGKDVEPGEGQSFGLCVFHPELADDPRMKRDIGHVFRLMVAWGRNTGFPIFDSEDLDRQIKKFLNALGPAAVRAQRREEEITVRVKELCTGRRLPLTISMKPPEAHRQEASLWT
jgi:hypothetical protein